MVTSVSRPITLDNITLIDSCLDQSNKQYLFIQFNVQTCRYTVICYSGVNFTKYQDIFINRIEMSYFLVSAIVIYFVLVTNNDSCKTLMFHISFKESSYAILH